MPDGQLAVLCRSRCALLVSRHVQDLLRWRVERKQRKLARYAADLGRHQLEHLRKQ
jgi:hypothetical protein